MGLGNGKADAAVTGLSLDGGNTVYFTITDHTHHYVEYVCPNENNVSWDGFVKPTGILDLPGTFDYMGVDYTATSIGNAAFKGCSGVYAVTIPSTVTQISSNAFSGTSLAQVNINSNAIASADYTYYSNFKTLFGSNVMGYTFGQGVTAIGKCAFYGCSFLKTVNIPNSVSSIGNSAFQGCAYLESIVLPNSLTTISNALFRDCTNLQQVTIPSSVTTIKDMAFWGCDHLNRINITDMAAWYGINYETWLGYTFPTPYSLYLNGNIVTNLILPNGLTTINRLAFANCTSLTSVTIPSSVTSIVYSAFGGCTGLTRVNISNLDAWCMINFNDADANPLTNAHHLYLNGTIVTNLNSLSSATHVGAYAFSGCTDLTSAQLPSSVTSIGNSAFINCSNMTSVSIPSTVNTIGNNAFSGCTGLTKVYTTGLADWCHISFGGEAANPLSYAHHLYNTNNSEITNLDLPYSYVTSISDYAFAGGTSFVSVTMRNTVTSIGQYAFKGCTGLTSVTIPISVNNIGNYAFYGCTNLATVTINSNAVASASYFGSRFGNQVTSYTFGPEVTAIGEQALSGCNAVTQVTFQGPVSSMGSYAFYNCSALTRVNVSNLDAWCEIDFDYSFDNPLYHAHHLYHNNSLVTSLDNLDSPASIGAYAYYGCTDFTSVTVPSSVQSVGNRAFYGCTDLTSVTINSNAVASASYFGSRFGNQVTSYTFGPEVTAIGEQALSGCNAVTQVTFQGPVSSMGSYAFYNCSALTRVNVSNLDAWCEIDFDYSFDNPLYHAHHLYHNNSLVTSLDNLDSPASIGAYAYYGCTDFTSVTVPSSVQSVGNRAFYGCTDLTSVTINSNAVASASYSYNDTFGSRFGNQVTSYTFGPEVTAIGQYALYGCTGITELYVGAMTPPTIYWNTFTNVSRSIPVYVPVGTGALYRAAEYWSQFTNFVETVFPEQWVEVPYLQTFDGSTIPDKWRSCNGALQGNNSPYTATLTPESGRWHFGAANGVFGGSSHAWVNIGGYLHHFWLVSPFLQLGDNNYMLSVDLALTRPSGTMVPITPDDQPNTRIYVLVSTDNGSTWTKLQAWRERDTSFTDLDVLTPEGYTGTYNLSAYANQNILIGFYMECTDADDASNRIHIDNFNVTSFDPTLAPTAVTVSQIASYSALVSWTPASSAQNQWDVFVAESGYEPQNDWTPEYMQQLAGQGFCFYANVVGNNKKLMTGLQSNSYYKAYVRYNDGTSTSAWADNGSLFQTVSACALPTDVAAIELTPTSALIAWTPGQANQTSWATYLHDVDGNDVYVQEPIRLLENLQPNTAYEFQVMGECEDGDGNSNWVHLDFTTPDYPTLTLNDGNDWSSDVVIQINNLRYTESWSQFVIPASQLTDLQYSTISKLQFYGDKTYREWGTEVFYVYLKEVDFDNVDAYCEYEFYDWSQMSIFHHGSLDNYSSQVLTITADSEAHKFHYNNGNLLVGIYQDTKDSNTQSPEFSWRGVDTTPNVALAPQQHDQPYCVQFLPKTTFTYETDSYLPPTDIVAEPIGNYEVYVSWTMRDGSTAVDFEISDDNFANVYDSYEDIEDGYFIYDDVWPEETFQVRLRSVFVVNGETIRSAWSQPVSFTMPEYCDSPYNLATDTIGPFSATLTWEGDAVEYNVEYREVLSEGFESGLPEGWTSLKGTETSGGWFRAANYHSGNYGLASICHTTNHGDNWLISPQVELGGVLSFWKTCAGPNTSFSIYVSTTGTDINDFGEPVATGTASSGWSKYTKSLSNFSGLGYIAIRHNDNTSTARALYIDDLLYTSPSWTPLEATTENTMEVSDLTPGKSYQFQVRGTCDTGFTSDWSSPFVFTTVNNIVFEDEITKGACIYAWDRNGEGNNDGELSYAEAAAVTDLGQVFRDQVEMTKFNELQYFTGLTSIGDQAFAGCVNLQEITLPPQITSIGNEVFNGCVSLQEITLPSSLTSIGYYSFASCSSLHNIVIPPSVTTIDYMAFRQSGLTEVILPPSVTSIGTLAFGECNNLEYVYLPASVTSIEGNAFTGTSIETIEVDQENPVYDSRGGCNAIIQTDIDNKLITGCKNTVIPDDVVSIGISAFENATSLTTINLPNSLESIGEYAFANCSGLTTINAEKDIPPTIYANTFQNVNPANITVNVPCGALTDYRNAEIWSGLSFNYVDPCNIVFTDANVKALCVDPATGWDTNGDGELSYAEAAAVTSIGTVFKSQSIEYFNELQYFTSLTSIDYQAFNACRSLVSIVLPNSISSIGNSSFAGCNALSSIDIPSSVATIEGGAFTSCYAFTEVTIPATVTNIGDNPFLSCRNLESITVEEGNPYYISPSGSNAIVRASDSTLISACKNTIIPDNIITIGKTAFAGITALTSVTIPSSVTSISNLAFWQCSNLTSITVLATDPPTLASNAFNLVPTDIPVYVPCESIEAYRNYNNTGQPWGGFTNYQESNVFICFADPEVKALCVDPATGWDTNGDGQLSYAEAAAVRTLNPSGASNSSVFKGNTTITSFDELQYFTGLSVIKLYAFQNCTALTSVILPPTVTTIEYEAFMNCGLTGTLTLPETVTTVEQDAFRECRGLTGLVIGSGVTSIGSLAFYNCTGLESITIEAVNPPALGTYNPFDNVPEDIPVYVPCGSVTDYQTYNNGAPWGGFNSIQGMGCENSRYLSAGWTWWVPYLDVTADELMDAFDEGTITGDILINSQSEGFLRRTNGEWGGTLSDFVVGKMYKIKTVSDGSFNYNGTRPTTVAVAIEPGYNWFGIQGNSTAIADLITPANGDKILKDDGTWVTFDGTYWIFDNGAYSGSFVIQPGIGYIYYNATNETKTMTFSY